MQSQNTWSEKSNNTIFIGGLAGSATKKSVQAFFQVYGKITEIQMHNNEKNPSCNKGYAIVRYRDSSSYSSCLKNPEPIFEGRVIMCKPYLKGQELFQYLEDLNNRRLFVKFVPKYMSNQDFEGVFCQYGKVDFGYVVKDPITGYSRGFGYITFVDCSIAAKVSNLKSIKIDQHNRMKIFSYKRRNLINGESLTDNPAIINSSHNIPELENVKNRQIQKKTPEKMKNNILDNFEFVKGKKSSYKSVLLSVKPEIQKNHISSNVKFTTVSESRLSGYQMPKKENFNKKKLLFDDSQRYGDINISSQFLRQQALNIQMDKQVHIYNNRI